MTRRGKIARLPRQTRDELNVRLENGEPGVRLVEWLNGLPEVKEILEKNFDGHPISEVNLSEWKNGGFLDWQAQREKFADMEDLKADGKELAGMTSGVADNMEANLLARYAKVLKRLDGELTEELRADLQCVGKSLRDLVRYRRYEQARERTKIQRETLDLKRQKTDEGQRKKFMELANDPKLQDKLTPKMTPEEKAQAIYDRFFPKDE